MPESPVALLSAIVAARLRDNSEVLVVEAVDRIVHHLPALGADEDVRSVTNAMAGASLTAFAEVLEDDVPAEEISAPWAATKWIKRIAWERVAFEDVERAWRIALEWLLERVVELAREADPDTETLAAFMVRAGTRSLRFVDVTSTEMSARFAQERERVVRGVLAERAGLVSALLDGGQVDVAAAERALGYRLDGTHQAFFVWTRDGASRAVGDVASRVIAVLQPIGQLILQEAPELVAVWLTVDANHPQPWDEVRRLLRDSAALLAAGEAARGVDGFRESRRQAERARAVAVAAADPDPCVLYRRSALASLLAADLDAARRFVREELGALAEDDETASMLRDTVLTLLRSAGPIEAAEALFVHRNTVAQRVRKAEEILGHPVSQRRQEIEAALLLCETLGRTVLHGA